MDSEPKHGRGLFDGWSKSSLKSILDGCSWQWALQRVGGLPGGSTPHSAAGTGLHAAIEEHERSRIGYESVPSEGTDVPGLGTLMEVAARAAWQDAASIPTQWVGVHGGQGKAAEWALDLTEKWYSSGVRGTLLGYTPLEVEPHLQTDEVPGPNILRGYLDWFGWDPAAQEYVVVDYKSSGDLRKWDNPAYHAIESAVYLYLAVSSGRVPDGASVRMEWHVVPRKGEPTILVGPKFGWDTVSFIHARVTEAQAIMDSAGYLTNPSWGLCSDRWCAFYHGCQVTGTLSPDSINFNRGSVDADSLPAPEPAPDATPPGPLSAGASGATPLPPSDTMGDGTTQQDDSRKE
jgi:hypothetical protein